MQSENKILVADDVPKPHDNPIAEATKDLIDGQFRLREPEAKKPITDIERAKIMEYFRYEAQKKHKNRQNTPFDAQLRNKKRAKVKRSRRANLDRLLRDKR